jgi:hypothetical protein
MTINCFNARFCDTWYRIDYRFDWVGEAPRVYRIDVSDVRSGEPRDLRWLADEGRCDDTDVVAWLRKRVDEHLMSR